MRRVATTLVSALVLAIASAAPATAESVRVQVDAVPAVKRAHRILTGEVCLREGGTITVRLAAPARVDAITVGVRPPKGGGSGGVAQLDARRTDGAQVATATTNPDQPKATRLETGGGADVASIAVKLPPGWCASGLRFPPVAPSLVDAAARAALPSGWRAIGAAFKSCRAAALAEVAIFPFEVRTNIDDDGTLGSTRYATADELAEACSDHSLGRQPDSAPRPSGPDEASVSYVANAPMVAYREDGTWTLRWQEGRWRVARIRWEGYGH